MATRNYDDMSTTREAAARAHARITNDADALPFTRRTTVTTTRTIDETDDTTVTTVRERIVSTSFQRAVQRHDLADNLDELLRQGIVPNRNGFDD
jgi:hypothetical protein